MGDVSAQARQSRSRFWLWTIFLTICVVIGLGKPIHDLHWRNKLTVYQQSARREASLRRQVGTEIWQRLYWVSGVPAEVVEEVLGFPAGHLANVQSSGRQSLTVDGRWMGRDRSTRGGKLIGPVRSPPAVPPDASGWQITLNFRDGLFAGAAAAPPKPTPPPDPLIRDGLELIMRAVLVLSPIVWLGGLLAGIVERTRGTRFGEVALAGAIAGTIAWAIYPGMLTTPAGHLGLVLGLVLMLVAVKVIRRLDRIARSRCLHFCYTCGYDLTGNVSGVCPECGMVTEEGLRRERRARAAAAAESVAHAVDDDPQPPVEADEEEAADCTAAALQR